MQPNNKTILKVSVCAGLVLIIIVCLLYIFTFSSPVFHQGPITVNIEPGQSVRSIARELKQDGVVKSAGASQILMVFFGGERNVKAGLYLFEEPENVFTVSRRIVRGDYGYIPVKLTIPEGTDSSKLSGLVHAKFPGITTSTVLALAKPLEGHLFPETYFFAPMITADSIIGRMASAFTAKIKPYEGEIKASGRSSEDIIKMASILEAEVQTDSDRKAVADLLWRRLDNGMDLQVDSTLGYVFDKTSAQLTLADLKADNPYNTYAYKGLPPTPISNPGLESIEAALRPTHNAYLFYLSDKNGITHFAKTYAEHLANKKKYLK
jgi:UPF0755 protein